MARMQTSSITEILASGVTAALRVLYSNDHDWDTKIVVANSLLDRAEHDDSLPPCIIVQPEKVLLRWLASIFEKDERTATDNACFPTDIRYWKLLVRLLTAAVADADANAPPLLPTASVLSVGIASLVRLGRTVTDACDSVRDCVVIVDAFRLLFTGFGHSTFRPTLDRIAQFSASLIELALQHHTSSNNLYSHVIALLEIVLDSWLTYGRQQANYRKLFDALMLPKIFRSVLTLRWHIVNTTGSIPLRLVDSIIFSALFHPAHIQDYALALSFPLGGGAKKQTMDDNAAISTNDDIQSAKRRKLDKDGNFTPSSGVSSFQRKLFESLRDMVCDHAKDIRNSALSFLPALYHEFLNHCASIAPTSAAPSTSQSVPTVPTSRKRPVETSTNDPTTVSIFRLPFGMLRELVDGVLANMVSAVSDVDTTRQYFDAVNALFTEAAQRNIYHVNNDPGSKMLAFFTAHMDRVLEHIRSADSDSLKGTSLMSLYDQIAGSVRVLLDLNSTIVDPHLATVCSCLIWTSIAEQDTAYAVCGFPHDLVRIFSEMRQLDRLFDVLCLSALSTPGRPDFVSSLAEPHLFDALHTYVAKMPLGLLPATWSVLLEHYHRASERIVDEPSALAPLGRIARLFVAFLSGVPVTETTAKKLAEFSLKMWDEALAPHLMAPSKYVLPHMYVASALYQFTLAIVRFTGSATSDARTMLASRLHDFITSQQCIDLVCVAVPSKSKKPMSDGLKNTTALYVSDVLSVQFLQRLHFYSETGNGNIDVDSSTTRRIIDRLFDDGLLSEIVQSHDCSHPMAVDAEAWDGRLFTIQRKDFPAVRWRVIGDNLSLLARYATEVQLRRILCIMFELWATLSGLSKTGSGPFVVTNRMLTNAAFYEVPELRRIIIAAAGERIYAAISSLVSTADDPPLTAMQSVVARATKDSAVSFADLSQAMQHPVAMATTASNGGATSLQQCTQIVRLVSAFPREYIMSTGRVHWAALLILLDGVVTSLLTAHISTRFAEATPKRARKKRHPTATEQPLVDKSAAVKTLMVCRNALKCLLDHGIGTDNISTVLTPTLMLHCVNLYRSVAPIIGQDLENSLFQETRGLVQAYLHSELWPERIDKAVDDTALFNALLRLVDVPSDRSFQFVEALLIAIADSMATVESRLFQNRKVSPGKPDPPVGLRRILTDYVGPLAAQLAVPLQQMLASAPQSDAPLHQLQPLVPLIRAANRLLECVRIDSELLSLSTSWKPCLQSEQSSQLLSLNDPLLRLAVRILSMHESDASNGVDPVQAALLDFLEVFSRSFHMLNPPLEQATFGKLLALVHHIASIPAFAEYGHTVSTVSTFIRDPATQMPYIASLAPILQTEGSTRGGMSTIDRIYAAFCRRGQPEHANLLVSTLKTELLSSRLHRVRTALRNCELFLSNTNAPNLLRHHGHPLLLKLLGILQNYGTTDRHICITCLSLIARIVSDKFNELTPRAVSLVFEAICPPIVAADGFVLSPEVFLAIYFVLSTALKRRPKEVAVAVSPFFANIRYLLFVIGAWTANASDSTQDDASRGEMLLACAANLSRLCEELVFGTDVSEARRVFGKHSVGVLADFVLLSTKMIGVSQRRPLGPLPPEVRKALLPGMYTLMSLSGENEWRHIYAMMDDVGKEFFKKLHTDYGHEWKFKGKI